jgi:hypothetical protein
MLVDAHAIARARAIAETGLADEYSWGLSLYGGRGAIAYVPSQALIGGLPAVSACRRLSSFRQSSV